MSTGKTSDKKIKKPIIGIVVLALLAGSAYVAFGRGGTSAAALEVTPEAALPAAKAGKQVVAEAKVVPGRSAELGLPTDGIVAEVLVTEGDRVETGQVLIRLNAARPAAAVAQAEAGLRRAQAQLDELRAGPRPQEIEVAKITVEAAQAQLAKLTQGARTEEIVAAEASLASAQTKLQEVLEGPSENEITIAAANLRQADIALKQAQWAYDEVAYADDVGKLPQAAELEQATLGYETAVANYHLAVRGATEADIAAARSELAQAEASLALLRQGPSEADIAAVGAEIRRAQAQLELLEAGARPEAIAAAEADVVAAQAALQQAQAALAETELRAPFTGTVASLDAEVGEQVTSGTPVMRLADLSAWQIETEDLTELSVVEIREGDPVTITFDAILGLELPGRVSRIKAIGENKQGEITYTVIIKPDRQDGRLRWYMTAFVTIEPE